MPPDRAKKRIRPDALSLEDLLFQARAYSISQRDVRFLANSVVDRCLLEDCRATLEMFRIDTELPRAGSSLAAWSLDNNCRVAAYVAGDIQLGRRCIKSPPGQMGPAVFLDGLRELRRSSRLYGRNHITSFRRLYYSSIHNLVLAMMANGEHEDAMHSFRISDVDAIIEDYSDGGTLKFVPIHHKLTWGVAHMLKRQIAGAYSRVRTALDAQTEKKNALYALTLATLGNVYGEMGETQLSESSLEEACEIYKGLGTMEGDVELLSCRNNLAVAYHRNGRTNEAFRLLDNEIREIDGLLGKRSRLASHPVMQIVRANRAIVR